MSDDLVSRLKSCAKDCTMLGDEVDAAFFNEAAKALTEARAEIERLRAGINGIVNCQGPMTRAQVREACAEILDNKTVGLDNQSPFAGALNNLRVRAVLAESELSTLRARVWEVVGPLASADFADCRDCTDNNGRPYQSQWLADALRAARQLNEDLKDA